MPVFNFIRDFLSLDITIYLFMSFAFYGVFLLIRKLVFNK